MENLEKEIDCKLTVAFRNKLICKNCDIFPRPIFPRHNTVIMRCTSCRKILCGKCCGYSFWKSHLMSECPLCQHKSKNIKNPTFTIETELMEVLSGLKTHPCINLKNGCLEEIPAKLDILSAHDQSCIFQKVRCPDCEQVVIFKDFGQHLKQHVDDSISIYYGTETNEYAYAPMIFGIYILQAELINGRKYYKKDKYAISWNGNDTWFIGLDVGKGRSRGFAHLEKNVQNLHNTTDWKLFFENGDWKAAGNMLEVKDNPPMSIEKKELNFEGTKRELFNQFFCVNAYDHQFYPQFKEVNNCLNIRTLMLGLQEEAIPFKVSITFFLENGDNLKIEDKVYPITEEKDSFLETSMNCHLKKLTKYYDAKTRRLIIPTKIDFSLKIISPKLDEIAKDQHFESGIEDTDEEMNEKDSANGKKRKISNS